MSALLPQHYALTEALVAAAGAIAIARTARVSPWFAIGLGPFAIAGLVGAIRIGAEVTGPIELLHQILSRPGALFGLGCLVGVLAGQTGWRPPFIGLAAAAIAVLEPVFGMSAFVGLILLGTVLAYRARPESAKLAASSFSLLLIGRLATDVLRSAHPALAWHMFHLVVAIWLLVLAAVVLPHKLREPTAKGGSR